MGIFLPSLQTADMVPGGIHQGFQVQVLVDAVEVEVVQQCSSVSLGSNGSDDPQ